VAVALGEPVVAGFTARQADADPIRGADTSGKLLALKLFSHALERQIAGHASHLADQFFLALTPTRVAVVEVRYGSGVKVKRVAAAWPRADVQLTREGAVLSLVVAGVQRAQLESVIPGEEDEALAALAQD
jgi:hypothetical protein